MTRILHCFPHQRAGSCPVQHPSGCPISKTSTMGYEGVVNTSHNPPPFGIVNVSPSAYSPNGCSCGSLVWIPSSCGAQSEVFLGSRPSKSQSIVSVTFRAGSPTYVWFANATRPSIQVIHHAERERGELEQVIFRSFCVIELLSIHQRIDKRIVRRVGN
jgi:hypothetical protein